MDDPSLDAQRHLQALRGLERINRWSGSARLIWSPIRTLARELGQPVLRVLDIATGAGDVPIRLWQAARRAGWRLHIEGCDRSSRAVEYAQQRAVRAGADVSFFACDALGDPIPSGYDILTSSLFLHHLDEEQAVALLRNMGQAARRMVVVNDLVRNVRGLALAYIGTRMLSASDVVHADAPQSVRAAYTVEEVRGLARRAGLEGAVVNRRWPSRFVLAWRRP